ncbi:DUF6284 family protein [Streptomyces sp. NPDC047315]|uniref:DUF6284 family protein n=1 Tax=Streptomyces sp. NPDC047315 TaxID=3155142 RepID=UPI00340DC0C6
MGIVPDLTIAEAVIAVAPWPEPTDAELDAIERELPLILAEVDELDTQIVTLDRTPTALDEQRRRRAQRRVLAARRDLANRSASAELAGDAA